MDNKINLRVEAKNIRKSLPRDLISHKLVQLLREDDLYINSKNVMIYYPMKFEIDLRELLNDDKNFYLPRVNDENLEVCPYHSQEELVKSSLGVFEPVCGSVSPNILDLVIVPALLADEKCYRLGYGGGYYDRFLKKNADFFKSIVLLPRQLYVKKLPVENFDVRVDKIILC